MSLILFIRKYNSLYPQPQVHTIMEHLYEQSDAQIRLAAAARPFRRYLFGQIHWQSRLIGILGARGTGKTTLLLQYLNETSDGAPAGVYLSLDDLYFSAHNLSETVSELYKSGARRIALDEVHKYPRWSQELKMLCDRYPELQIVFSGSSIIDISRQQHDLSRRAVMYQLHGLSYREYLGLRHNIVIQPQALTDLLSRGKEVTAGFDPSFRPLQHFGHYLQFGFYPFFLEEEVTYMIRLNQVVRTIVEYDMAEMEGFDVRNSRKILQLLSLLSTSVPFRPNISKLSEKISISRTTLLSYLHLLEQAQLISMMHAAGKSTSMLQKPEKILINNPNLMFMLSRGEPDAGSVRESFALQQLRVKHQVSYPAKGDFLVDDTFTLETGGPGKGRQQLQGTENAFVVSDRLEYPTANRIPLWMLGLLY